MLEGQYYHLLDRDLVLPFKTVFWVCETHGNL